MAVYILCLCECEQTDLITNQVLAWKLHTAGRSWWRVWHLHSDSSPLVARQEARLETVWQAEEGPGMTCQCPRHHSGSIREKKTVDEGGSRVVVVVEVEIKWWKVGAVV